MSIFYDPLGFVRRLLSDIDVPFPTDPLSPETLRAIGLPDQTVLRLEAYWARIRHGPQGVFFIELVGVNRVMEFVGDNVRRLNVSAHETLRGEAFLIHPELGAFNVPISLRSGEQWSQERQTRQIASALKEYLPDADNRSDIVRQSKVRINWYLTTYVKPTPIQQ